MYIDDLEKFLTVCSHSTKTESLNPSSKPNETKDQSSNTESQFSDPKTQTTSTTQPDQSVGAAAAQHAYDSREESHARRNPDYHADPSRSSPDPAVPRPQPHHDPLAAPPRSGPYPDFAPPGLEDEHQLQRSSRDSRGDIAMPDFGGLPRPLSGPRGSNPYGIGGDDLNPPGLGPRDPLRPSFVPGGYGGEFGGPEGFGGMHPTFDDPLFRGQGGRDGRGGPGAGHPDGARWDPLGPDGNPRDNRGPGFPGGRPGGGRGGFGGGFGGGMGGPPNPFGGYGPGDFM